MAYKWSPIRQAYFGTTADTKPTSVDIGAILYEINTITGIRKTYQTHNGITWTETNDDSLGHSTNPVYISFSGNIPTSLLSGTSTSNGTTATLIDSTKNLELNSLNNRTIKFAVDNTEYIRNITSSVGDTIGFVDTQPASSASVTVTGSTGGSMVINCKTLGASGNDYSVILVAGTGISQQGTVSFADNLLTITSPTNIDGDPDQIMPGNVEGIIQTDPELSELFVVGIYEAGKPLDILSESVPFTGGSDGVIVVSGVDYVVF